LVGEKYNLYCKSVEKFIKKGRYYGTNELSLIDKHGKEVVRMRYTQIYFGAPTQE
jgi:hypothetical protein